MNFLIELLISFIWDDFEAIEHPYVMAFSKGIFIGLLMCMYYLFKNYFFNIASAISVFETMLICLITGVGISILLMLVEFIFPHRK